MAIALVSGQNAERVVTGVNNTTLAYPGNVTSGNLLVVWMAAFEGGGADIQTPTDTRTSTYTAIDLQVEPVVGAVMRGYWAIAPSSGANTVTFDLGGTATGDITVSVAEFSGVHATPFVDGQNAGGTGTAVSTGDVTPTEDNCLLVAAVTHSGLNTTFTEEAGWTLLQEHEGGSADMPLATQYKVQTTATTEDADWTLGASRTWATQIGVWKSSGGAPATAVKDIIGVGVIPWSR